jgi:hypothetical protein
MKSENIEFNISKLEIISSVIFTSFLGIILIQYNIAVALLVSIIFMSLMIVNYLLRSILLDILAKKRGVKIQMKGIVLGRYYNEIGHNIKILSKNGTSVEQEEERSKIHRIITIDAFVLSFSIILAFIILVIYLVFFLS